MLEFASYTDKNFNVQDIVAIQNVLTDVIRCLYLANDTDYAFATILEKLGRFFEADRAYVYEVHQDKRNNTHEWCEQHIAPNIQNQQDVPTLVLTRWQELFRKNRCVVVADRETLRTTDPLEYGLYLENGITSIVAAPLKSEGRFVGYIGVDNPSGDKLPWVELMLETLSYFFAAELDRKKSNMRLQIMSRYDSLTGAHNRGSFVMDSVKLKQETSGIGVVSIDVNGLKEINERFGQEQGDEVLVSIAKTLRRTFPHKLVYRLSGDEFAVIAKDTSLEEFEKSLCDMKEAFSQELSYNVSVGHRWASSGENLDQMEIEAQRERHKDKRRYYHKNASTQRYRHEYDDILELAQRDTLLAALENGQFQVYLQPKVSISGRSLIGAEALIRYTALDGTLVTPDQFIPMLENAELIDYVDFYVLNHVCKKLSQWLAEGRNAVPISVNFSRHTLLGHNFFQRLNEIWGRYSIPIDLIELEVTEGIDVDNRDMFSLVLQQLRSSGFVLAIDDFGVLNSNLSLFTMIDFDVLKIDKTLIDNLPSSEKSQAVLRLLVELCQGIGVQVIVEGVDSEEKMDILQQFNCAGAQGFLFDRPIPVVNFEDKYLH